MFGNVTNLASESIGIAGIFYTAFETPITFILSILGVGIMAVLLIKAFK